MTIEILASSTADPTKNVQAPVTITAFGTTLNGTYVLQAQGSDSTGSPYQIAGVLALDGTSDTCSGFITSGQQTLNTVSGGSVTTPISGSSGTPCAPGPSSYFIGTDGRGTITLATTDQNNNAVTETFSLAVLSSSRALIAELDSTGTSSGTLELQDPAAAGTLPIGAYAFVASGTDTGANPIAYGGVVNIDSSGNIAGTNSLADQTGSSKFGGFSITSCSPPNGPSGTVSWFSNPSSVVSLSLTTANCFSQLTFIGYIVDATDIHLIETDGAFFTAGPAIGQGSAAGILSNASFSGPYAFGVLGIASLTALPSSFTSLSVICPDGNGGLTSCTDAGGNSSGGYTDTLFLLDNTPIPGQNSPCTSAPCPGQVSSEITSDGTYQIDAHKIGRIRLMKLKLSTQPNPIHPFSPDMNFYLTGPPGSPALVLFTGGASMDYPALGAGIAYPQQQPANALSFGNGELYGVSFTQQPGTENDGTGQMTATENQGAPGGTLSGLADDTNKNSFQVPPSSDVLTGAFSCPQGAASCPDPFGRFSSSTFLANQTSTAVDYYLIDQDHAFFVETDLLSLIESGSPQVALGYFAKRCDVTVTNSCQQAAEKSSRRRAWKGRHSHRPLGTNAREF